MIACVPTVGVQYLPHIIREYATRYPQNRIQILDHASSGVADAVLRREAEFGIHIGGAHHAELTSVSLLQDRVVLICRDDHPLAGRAEPQVASARLPSADLRRQREREPAAPRCRLGARGIALQAHYEVQRSSTALGLVAEGVAAAVVPSLAIQKGTYPRITVVALTDPVVARTLVLVARKRGHSRRRRKPCTT